MRTSLNRPFEPESNNPTVVGPPEFEDSAFDVPARDRQVHIGITY